jgi:hypothetical protein
MAAYQEACGQVWTCAKVAFRACNNEVAGNIADQSGRSMDAARVIDDRHGVVTVPVKFWAENLEYCVVIDLRQRHMRIIFNAPTTGGQSSYLRE